MNNLDKSEQLREVSGRLKAGVENKLADIWWYLVLRGVLALALGVFALFWPDKNLKLLVMAVGIYCLADGTVSLISSIRQSELRENLIQALVVLVVGAILLWWPGATLRSLLVLLGAAILFIGIGQVLAARRLAPDDTDRATTMSIGVAAVVIGAVLALWPGSGVAAISWVIGIAAILIGALLTFLGTRFRKLRNRVDTLGNPARPG